MNGNGKTNKVAVVTGATGGLGRPIALAFWRSGYRVVINYVRSDQEARDLFALMGERAMAVRADVGDCDEVAAMAGAVRRQWGGVDVLVNNAGITRDALLIKQKETDWDDIMKTNLGGAFHMIRAFVPLMHRGGHVVNISSYSGLKGKEGQGAYSASKAALLGLTKAAAHELAALDIRVNAVLPGYLPTSMGEKAAAAMERAKEASLLNTLSNPEEVARFIVYLSGTTHITGQVFSLDSRII